MNQADNLIYTTEKQLREFGDKIPADKKATIENALNELREAHKSEDLKRIDDAMAKLNSAWSAASEEMYRASQTQSNTSNTTTDSQSTSDGNVTDAEYEEIK